MQKNMCLVILMALCACGSAVPPAGTGVDAGVGCKASSECAQPCADLGYSKAICASEGVCVCIDISVDAGTPQAQCSATNRASLAKMVIVAIDGLASYQAPRTPTYDDVQPNSWYYDYVESAVQLGIMEGYTDVSGNLTGKFGPSDQVNRAQAIKVIVNAFNVPMAPSQAMPFTDVVSGNWYANYLKAAFAAGIVTDSGDHLFRPSDWADICWVNEAILKASQPQNREPQVVIVDRGPAAQSVLQGLGNIHALGFSLVTDADLTVKASRLDIRVYNTLGVLGSDDAVYFSIRNIKVIDTDSGSTLQGPIATAQGGQTRLGNPGFWHSFLLNEDFDLTAGGTRNLAVVLDVDGLFPSGYSLDVKYSLRPEDAPWTSYVKDMAANEYLGGGQIIGDPLTSKRVTVQ